MLLNRCKLRIDNIEGILDEDTPVPCLIKVREDQTKGEYSEYFSFAGKESIYYLKEYLKRRTPLKASDYLFTHDNNDTPINTDLISHTFRRTVIKLKKEKIIDFENKKALKQIETKSDSII